MKKLTLVAMSLMMGLAVSTTTLSAKNCCGDGKGEAKACCKDSHGKACCKKGGEAKAKADAAKPAPAKAN